MLGPVAEHAAGPFFKLGRRSWQSCLGRRGWAETWRLGVAGIKLEVFAVQAVATVNLAAWPFDCRLTALCSVRGWTPRLSGRLPHDATSFVETIAATRNAPPGAAG